MPPRCGETEELHGTGSFQDRQYLLRLPCVSAGAPRSLHPLLVVVHCFGCSAHSELHKWTAEAERRGFALAAPVGVESSFNAPSCCGTARAGGVDDVGFVDAVVDELLLSRKHSIDPEALFVTGFSNGGFLASHLASHLSSKSRTRWAAVAPVAGHEYAVLRASPLPVAIHHCVSDMHVNGTSGCCARADAKWPSGSTCCCDIQASKCTSHDALFHTWRAINRCAAYASERGVGGATCLVGAGCAAETSLCWHGSGCFHQRWVSHFPAVGAVLDFFGRQPGPAKRGAAGAVEAWAPESTRRGGGAHGHEHGAWRAAAGRRFRRW